MAELPRYKDKVAIVTGGANGIGRGCVETFVQHGAKVVICDKAEGDGKLLESTLNRKSPGNIFFLLCDVTKEEDIKKAINATIEKYGKLDCLINVAGDHPRYMYIDDTSVETFRSLLAVNLVGYFLFSKHALPYLRKTEGNIINCSSVAAQTGEAGSVAYLSTKGSITAFTKALAIDEAGNNVRVNCISPGNTWTPLWERLAKEFPDGKFDLLKEGGEDESLVGRFGTPEECGLTCLFLAAEATFCTGIDLNVSGGYELSCGNKNRRKAKDADFL